MHRPTKWFALALAASLAPAAHAHKMFLVPSATVSSAGEAWVTFDAAVSNDLFHFDHRPAQLDALEVIGPDGKAVEVENRSSGRLRSTFDLHLAQPGTYRVALRSAGLFASYVDAKGEKKRWRGSAERLGEIPADAKNVEIGESQGSVNAYVTLGKPNDAALKPSGHGLELVPVTAPNDLVAGEPARFRFLVDGKPAANLEVTVIAGGTRYRDRQDEIVATTDADGGFSVTWPNAGLYWLHASLDGQKPTIAKAKERRLSYTATFEVLPQ